MRLFRTAQRLLFCATLSVLGGVLALRVYVSAADVFVARRVNRYVISRLIPGDRKLASLSLLSGLDLLAGWSRREPVPAGPTDRPAGRREPGAARHSLPGRCLSPSVSPCACRRETQLCRMTRGSGMR